MKYLFLIVVILVGVTLYQCKSTSRTSQDTPTYLALGDSYTIGERVSIAERWPNQLKDSLAEKGVKVGDITIIAKTGWRTDELLGAIDSSLDVDEKFDVVSVLIGVNNQYQGRSISDYESDLKTVFEKAIAHSKRGAKGIFALNIPDYGSSKIVGDNAEQVAQEIDDFNAVFERMASSYKIRVHDINRISKKAYNNENLIASDGLHPSGAQYALWVQLIVPYVKPLF